jgi:hypothetical protein
VYSSGPYFTSISVQANIHQAFKMRLNIAAIISGLLATAVIAAPSRDIVKKDSTIDISKHTD